MTARVAETEAARPPLPAIEPAGAPIGVTPMLVTPAGTVKVCLVPVCASNIDPRRGLASLCDDALELIGGGLDQLLWIF